MTGKAVDFCREDTPPLGGSAAAPCLKADVLRFGKQPVYRACISYILFSEPAFQTTPPGLPRLSLATDTEFSDSLPLVQQRKDSKQ